MLAEVSARNSRRWSKMGDTGSAEQTSYDIPKECIGGVVTNEGPNFTIEVKQVPVPEIGKLPGIRT